MTARLTLAQQLKQLEEDEPKSIEIDSAYSNLDGLSLPAREKGEGREHYVDVGPSRLRAATAGDVAQTLLSDKYGGKSTSRMKIFDDEDEEQEEALDYDEDFNRDLGDYEDEIEDEDEEDEDDEDEEEEDDEEKGEEEDDVGEEPSPRSSSSTSLDPIKALREARQKDVEKGRGIKRQRELFDSILTLRITFQKALTASFKLPAVAEITDPAGELLVKRHEALMALGKLNESLFKLREQVTLSASNEGDSDVSHKRRRMSNSIHEAYWAASVADSLDLGDASHSHLIPILHKWSTKIQAASLQLGSKQAGGSKFLASTRGGASTGVVDAIDAALSSRRDAPKPLLEIEEAGYRSLLREVIESRQGAAGVDLSHLRREKKKKREAERGGSKGRKLRYTVHDKAANFVVPTPLAESWQEEQVDELFSSLFGGAGPSGAFSVSLPSSGAGEVVNMADLGGLKVF